MSETISMEYLANLSARLAKAEAQVQAVRQLREQWATREVTDAEFEMYQELGRALGSGSG